MKARDKNKTIKVSSERSELAVQRTILANARTFSAWIRTGLAAVLGGLTIVGFTSNNQIFTNFVYLLGMLIGFSFVAIGVFIYITAYISYRKSYYTLKKEELRACISLKFLLAITSGMTIITILIALLMIFL